MKKSFRFITMTGVVAGLTLTAIMSASAATTDTIKTTKSRLLDRTPARTQRADVRRSTVKTWKYNAPRQRAASNQRYLGGYKAWYGDSAYFGNKLHSRGYAGTRNVKTPKYSGKFLRPTNNRTYDSFRTYQPGTYRTRLLTSQKCAHMTAYSGQHRCCTR